MTYPGKGPDTVPRYIPWEWRKQVTPPPQKKKKEEEEEEEEEEKKGNTVKAPALDVKNKQK